MGVPMPEGHVEYSGIEHASDQGSRVAIRCRHIVVLVLSIGLVSCHRHPVPETSRGAVDLEALESVTIHYQRNVRLSRSDERYQILPSEGRAGYTLTGSDLETSSPPWEVVGEIPRQKLQALLAAIVAPKVDRQDAINAVAAQIEPHDLLSASSMVTGGRGVCSREQRQAWIAAYLERTRIRRLVAYHYTPINQWSDDLPELSVSVKLKGRAPIAFHAISQKAMMLPWSMGDRQAQERLAQADATGTWSVELSRTVAALIPRRPDAVDKFDPHQIASMIAWDLTDLAADRCRID
jgi:hypothetical protein